MSSPRLLVDKMEAALRDEGEKTSEPYPKRIEAILI
jgi:hypothetical protein